MSPSNVWAALLLATLSLPAYSQQDGAGSGHRPGEGGRPSEAQIAEWRARKAAREAAQGAVQTASAETPAASAGPATERPAAATHDHGRPVATAAPKAEDGSRNGGRPGGAPSQRGSGGNVLWLADTPPARGDGPPRGGMAMGGGHGGHGGPPVKRLWLRAGTDPQKSGFARESADGSLELLLASPGTPGGEPLAAAEEPRKGLAFEMPVQGYYRLYATSRRLQGDTLAVSVAKAEVANFSHGGDEEERARALTAPRLLDAAPIEIVRERLPDEKAFFQLKSGDEQGFLVLQRGLPLPGARVRFVSHQGWTKEAVSDEQGRVVFQVIRDYFPPWEEFQKRFKASYLVIAEASAAEAGTLAGQPYANVRYQSTLAGSYYPSPNDYRSYGWGLGVGLAGLLACGVAIHAYRRRRTRPFQEVQLDEKA